MTTTGDHRHDDGHAARGDILNDAAKAILQRGIEELLEMTEGLDIQPLRSAKFLQAHGGWNGVVWVSPKVAAFMGEQLPAHATVGDESPST